MVSGFKRLLDDADSDYLNMILMTMPGSLIVIGTDAAIKAVNQATLDLTGYEEEELLGKPMEMLLHGAKLNSINDKLGKKGFVRHGERIYLTKDGEQVPVAFSSAIMRDTNKRVLGIVCIAQDISTLKQMESELNERVMQLGILHQVDYELTHMLSVDHVLSLGLDITMRLSLAEAGGIALIEDGQLYVAESIGYVRNAAQDFTQNSITARVLNSQTAELIHDVKSDTAYVPVLPSTRAIISVPMISQDRPVGILHLETSKPDRFTQETFEFLQLITARIAVATDNARLYDTSVNQLDELQRLYAQVSALEQIKTDMIRIAAHDLRNPLNNLAMSAKLLRKTAWEMLSEPQRERVTDIEDSIKRMQKVTADILSLERINQAATGEFTAIVDLEYLVRQAFDSHRGQAKSKNQAFDLTIANVPLFVRGEAVELQEAAANFISNAIKYTPDNGRISVSLNQNDEQVIFEVKDTGYGIPDEQQARLFQPFFRAETAETQVIEGTGLGLHLVKNIIERHKGKIRFQSKRGEGSTFGFELPLIPIAMDAN